MEEKEIMGGYVVEIEKVSVAFNSSGDTFDADINIEKEFDTKEEAIAYLNGKEFYNEILDVLEDEGEWEEDYNGHEHYCSYAEMASEYGGCSIEGTLTQFDENENEVKTEEIYGDVEVDYVRRKGYVVYNIEYDFE